MEYALQKVLVDYQQMLTANMRSSLDLETIKKRAGTPCLTYSLVRSIWRGWPWLEEDIAPATMLYIVAYRQSHVYVDLVKDLRDAIHFQFLNQKGNKDDGRTSDSRIQ
ncbi:hypothetical protein BSKO_03572 [Bryopsis sp. KO-2023]|nr:hypothetical protein BSKO_03572 [Bryopsis sp. KO-2023]